MGRKRQDEAFLEEHQEAAEIFKLAQLMEDAGLGYWFNYDDEFQEAIDEDYEYVIEVQTGELVGGRRAPITVFLNRYGENREGLELLDMRPARNVLFPEEEDGELHTGLSAEQAMEIIDQFFKEA